MDIILSLLIGVVAGFAGGLFGIGGGIVVVPALALVLGYSQHKAQGTSLVALLAPVGIIALIEYYRKGEADIKIGSLIAVGFLAGSIFGARYALGLDENLMRRAFAVFLALIAVWMFISSS